MLLLETMQVKVGPLKSNTKYYYQVIDSTRNTDSTRI